MVAMRRSRRASRPGRPGGSQCIGDYGKGENELQGFVEEGPCTKPCVPARCFRALRVDREGHAANFCRHGQPPFTGRHEQVATPPGLVLLISGRFIQPGKADA